MSVVFVLLGFLLGLAFFALVDVIGDALPDPMPSVTEATDALLRAERQADDICRLLDQAAAQ